MSHYPDGTGPNDPAAFLKIAKQWLSYDKETGVFLWKKEKTGRGRNAVKKDSVAGSVNTKGYRQISFFKKSIKAHRLAWLFCFKVWPTGEIDHINGKKDDNRIKNLRQATTQQNCQNRKIHRSGRLVGTYYCKTRKTWTAQIRINGKKTRLGSFLTEKEAYRKYMEAYRERVLSR